MTKFVQDLVPSNHIILVIQSGKSFTAMCFDLLSPSVDVVVSHIGKLLAQLARLRDKEAQQKYELKGET